MINLTPHQAAALNYNNSISLSANAGSGKTFVLSRRYLQIALETDTPLKKIAAITFTEKAAGELYRKIAGEVDKLLVSESDEKLEKKLIRIRRQLVSANISTIHSFCIDILKEFPVEAGLDANFIPIDSRQADELLDLSIEDVFSVSSPDKNLTSLVQDLIRLFFSEGRLRTQFKYLFNKRKSLESLKDSIYQKNVKEISNFYKEEFVNGLGNILNKNKKRFINNIAEINQLVLKSKKDNRIANEASVGISKFEKEENVFAQLDILNNLENILCTTAGSIRKKGYLSQVEENIESGKIQMCEEFFKELSSFSEIQADEELSIRLAEYGKMIIELYDKIQENYSNRKQVQGFLDFEDILIKTKNLLELNPVRKMLSDKFSYLMIDEYQDTNDIQYEIFLPLLDNLRKGNLFIVGDEKQSIYMFRDADISVFRKTSLDIKKVSGGKFILNLPDSFRMSPAICLFTNKLFEKLFDAPDELYNEVKHSDLICSRDDGFPGKIEFLINDAAQSDISEADVVASSIIKLKNNNSTSRINSWNEIAVLVRKRTSFSELERSFTKYNIPYSIIGGKGFYQRQPIYDIYNYFSFLLDQNNDTAFVGILRSPFFNISDSKIFSLQAKGAGSLWSEIQKSENENPDWDFVFNSLDKMLKLCSSATVPELLRMILQQSEYLSVISASANGVQEIANIDKLIKLTSEFYFKGFTTLYDYVAYLKAAIDGLEDEAQADTAETEDSVNLMTIHQSKGLEYTTVFLFKCAEISQENHISAKSLVIDRRFGILTKIPSFGNYFSEYKSPPINLLYNFIEEKRNFAEIKRLLYVAVTRAKDYLFISSELKEDKSPPAKSFIYLLQNGLGIDFEEKEFELSGQLNFLHNIGEKFQNSIEKIRSTINITRNSDLQDDVFNENISNNAELKIFNTKIIRDRSKKEIISATKFSVHTQCPLKYQLMYQMGFNKLMDEQHNWSRLNQKSKNFEFNDSENISLSNEDQISTELIASDAKGKLIHKILEKNPTIENISELINQNIILMTEAKIENESLNLSLQKIEEELKGFLDSREYKYLNSSPNFYNEYEIYLKEDDFYLFGIIDKLIVNEDKILIIDYKTDDIKAGEIGERAKTYENQLAFYSYILKDFFKSAKRIEGRIEFIKHPNRPVIFHFNEKIWLETKQKLNNFIKNLRENNFSPNLDHCRNCSFYLTSKKCVAI